jgi:hypothetical protein
MMTSLTSFLTTASFSSKFWYFYTQFVENHFKDGFSILLLRKGHWI